MFSEIENLILDGEVHTLCVYFAFKNQIFNRHSMPLTYVLLNLLNELRKRDKMRGLPSILSLFHKFNNSLILFCFLV